MPRPHRNRLVNTCQGYESNQSRATLAFVAAQPSYFAVKLSRKVDLMTNSVDFLIIGGGIAGASAGYWLSRKGSLCLLEMEAQPGYHTTGRSAALFADNYGNAAVRAITKATKPFLLQPPEGFTEHPILSPRGALLAADAEQTTRLDDAYTEAKQFTDNVFRLGGNELFNLAPFLDRQKIVEALYEPDCMDIDVHALHQGYLKGLRANGGTIQSSATVNHLHRSNTGWTVQTSSGAEFHARIVVNAAGAWADQIAHLAGIAPIGLIPKRRTAFTFDAPADIVLETMPATIGADETWYVKPEAGRLLGSPADETPSAPCDAQPEELDLAIAVDRVEQHTTFTVKRFHSRWAGLRSFVADKTFVVGFEPGHDGFFWLAGQGGYGIQTSAGLAQIAAALACGDRLPADMQALGINADDLAPTRPSLQRQ